MKNSEVGIAGFVHVGNGEVRVNGELVYKTAPTGQWLTLVYEHFKIDYPRFFKMDGLCKVSFLATELLMQVAPKVQLLPSQTAMVVSTRNSSLDTDIKYEMSTHTTPSPALFVYTLPNVLIGEVCIRHGWKGEAACFVFNIFNADFQSGYVNQLLQGNKAERCISGWADFYNENAEAFFYLAQEEKPLLAHNSTNLSKIYQAL